MQSASIRSFGDLLKDKNIILRGADAATTRGFTQVPNFLLRSRKLNVGDKMAFAMLLSYAWQNDYCFPGQKRLAEDMGIDERNVRRHLKALEANGLLSITRRGCESDLNTAPSQAQSNALFSRAISSCHGGHRRRRL